MKIRYLGIFLYMMIGVVCVQAQTSPYFSYGPTTRTASERASALHPSFLKGNLVPAPRTASMTIDTVDKQMTREKVSASLLASIANDTNYIKSLTDEQASDLAYAFSYIYLDMAGSAEQIKYTVLNRLEKAPYNEKSADFSLYSFYAMAAACLGHSYEMHQQVYDWAFSAIKATSNKTGSAQEGLWSSVVLSVLAEEASSEDWPMVMSAQERMAFEKRLEDSIMDFDWMKDETSFNRSLWKISNQEALLSLFIQANSFFAAKDDDNIIKSLVTTGGFNAIGRMVFMDGNDSYSMRFSDDGEVFYLAHRTPGTDGNGHFEMSAHGRRHQTLAQLIQALVVSYASRNNASSSRYLQTFTRRYFSTGVKGGAFVHYLYVPLHAMRNGRVLLDNFSLNGWEAEEKQLSKELYSKIEEGYPVSIQCSNLHGLCEVMAEWYSFGAALKWLFKGGKVVVSGTGKAVARTAAKVLPEKVVFRLVVADLGARQALKFTKQGIRGYLKKHGWKTAVAGGGTAAVRSDSN